MLRLFKKLDYSPFIQNDEMRRVDKRISSAFSRSPECIVRSSVILRATFFRIVKRRTSSGENVCGNAKFAHGKAAGE